MNKSYQLSQILNVKNIKVSLIKDDIYRFDETLSGDAVEINFSDMSEDDTINKLAEIKRIYTNYNK